MGPPVFSMLAVWSELRPPRLLASSGAVHLAQTLGNFSIDLSNVMFGPI